jgi:dipeptidase E
VKINNRQYIRFSILPHFQEIRDLNLDGLRVLEDISLPDSCIRPFYALVDGSYILSEDNSAYIYGEAYWVKDGTITKVCENNQSIQLS